MALNFLNTIRGKKKPLIEQQLAVLNKLLEKARFTEFGQKYYYDLILKEHDLQIAKSFQQRVPIFNYDSIFSQWWHKNLEGGVDVCWPGKIKYFALTSGTSGGSSKFVPITNSLITSNKNIMVRQLFSLKNYQNIPHLSTIRGWLSLGGSTDLQKYDDYYAGDLSGISAKKRPFWFTPFYKPGLKISSEKNWLQKLESIAENAPNWDIGFILGVPAWTIMLFEIMIKKYNIKNIHEIWPNFDFYVHGGVNFEPYKKNFQTFLGKPITYVETYLASEGFLAYQNKQNYPGMKLVANEHIFFEFIPFTEENFDADGNLKPRLEVKLINEVVENQDYAILISTNGGAWRYLIGDTIRFIDVNDGQIIITGRTKLFLSLVGEHVSIDNMNQAILMVAKHFNIYIPEFTVCGIRNKNLFSHHWYIASNDPIDPQTLLNYIDQQLQEINDDYRTERCAALKEIKLTLCSTDTFLNFLQSEDRIGSQQKFPRVLKGALLEKWKLYISENPHLPTVHII
ncbi:MAG: GH3 auxin-responsive promoter family protein [Sediminibacterium sp.]|nr:GH3 auxin-responsive promoter family protein [Sediminibacterium sp.]